jgi:hypothetical protein
MKSRRSNPSGNCVEARWKNSTYCLEGNCAEVRSVGQQEAIQVRDSKNPDADILTFTTSEWTAFVDGVKAGEFDLQGGS